LPTYLSLNIPAVEDDFILIVKPIHGCVGSAINSFRLASVRSTAGRQNTVDKRNSVAAASITKEEPVHSTSAIGSRWGRTRSFGAVNLLCNQQLTSLVKVESRNTGRVEVVMAKVGDLL
jgi:hypothetical protein